MMEWWKEALKMRTATPPASLQDIALAFGKTRARVGQVLAYMGAPKVRVVAKRKPAATFPWTCTGCGLKRTVGYPGTRRLWCSQKCHGKYVSSATTKELLSVLREVKAMCKDDSNQVPAVAARFGVSEACAAMWVHAVDGMPTKGPWQEHRKHELEAATKSRLLVAKMDAWGDSRPEIIKATGLSAASVSKYIRIARLRRAWLEAGGK